MVPSHRSENRGRRTNLREDEAESREASQKKRKGLSIKIRESLEFRKGGANKIKRTEAQKREQVQIHQMVKLQTNTSCSCSHP